MLSRRNVRIKVMQMLYAASRNEGLPLEDLIAQYHRCVDQSFQLYLFNVLWLVRVAEYARQDHERRAAKFLPSEEDRRFTPKLADNALVERLLYDEGFQKLLKKYHLKERVDPDTVRLLYGEFVGSEHYQAYLAQEASQMEDHIEVLLRLYKNMNGQEIFNETMEDLVPQWVDDKSLVLGAVKKTVKSQRQPVEGPFYLPHLPADDTVKEFGEALLRDVYQNDADLLDIIEPTLQNWDVDRVAVLDMILLKMALSELLAFPTIPAKVTLNEFVEISKRYSTDKSKEFINGILDRLLKQLEKEGRIGNKGL